MNKPKRSFLERVILNLFSVVRLKKEDVILSSFPRSGNTWLRFFLCNLISLNEWDGKAVDFQLLNKTMPEFGGTNLVKVSSYYTIPRVIKTHKFHMPFFNKNSSIGIIRDPRDVMVSYYHYKKYRQKRFGGTFSEFIRCNQNGLETWFRHYRSWNNHWTIIIQYEAMIENPLNEFMRVLDILGVKLEYDIVVKALKRSNRQNVTIADKSFTYSTKREAQFVRSGQTRQWIQYFDNNDLAYYYELVDRYKVFIYN